MREGSGECTRFEICSAGGAPLAAFGFDECTEAGPHEFRGIRRRELVGALHDACRGDVRYGVDVAGADLRRPEEPRLVLGSGERLRCRAVVGADGARSRVARGLGVPPPNLAGMTAHRGVAEFGEGELAGVLPPGTIRMLWGSGARAGLYPINDREAYWFTVFDDAGAPRPPEPGERLREEALGVVRGWGGGIREAIARTPAGSLTRNRVADRWVAPGSEVGRGPVTLVGDALHPSTPNLGQGGACALEGAVRLAGALRRAGVAGAAWGRASPGEVAAAMRAYERAQTRRVFPLQARSWAMGRALHLPFPVTLARDAVVGRVLRPDGFMHHASFEHEPLTPP